MKKLLIIPVAAVVLAGCSGSSSHHLSQRISCAVQVAHWYKHGGKNDTEIFKQQFEPMVKAAKSHNNDELKKDTAGVEAAAQVLKHNLPPNCAPGVNGQISAALTDVSNSAEAVSKNDYRTVKADMRSAEVHTKSAAVDAEKFAKGDA